MNLRAMDKTSIFLLVWFFSMYVVTSLAEADSSKIYIVYMGDKVHSDPQLALMENHEVLASVNGGSVEAAGSAMVSSYHHGFRGFAAHMSNEQAQNVAKMPGVISVFPNKLRKLDTTHSWEYLGMPDDNSLGMPSGSTRPQENVIIGFIDTGIWPESPSFSDHDMSPVPPRWKGICQAGDQFPSSTCNRKLIGARYYVSGFETEEEVSVNMAKTTGVSEYRSARDSLGHGSHTASTAAGRFVSDMNYRGLASGGARGGAPLSRIAIYKACWDSGCYDSDLLAAFDDAIRDGVDILSLSLGPDVPENNFFSDAISVGSFHAAQHGITVVCSVGNDGGPGSATNVAPWVITVAASSTDRDFTSDIYLNGRNTTYRGESLNLDKMASPAKLMFAANAHAKYFTPYQSSYCLNSSLDNAKVAGKVLVCLHPEDSSESKVVKSQVVKAAGGVGMILIDDMDKNLAIPFLIPSAVVSHEVGEQILRYINSTKSPKAYISQAKTVYGVSKAPQIAPFSSKGPNSVAPDILKPDITAPGLNILAAWSPARKGVHFNILSGTSMACPHVTGLAALIKAEHPSWSLSVIKSALMTTANVLDKDDTMITVAPQGRPGTPFEFGAGIVRPMMVNDPGLVYDATAQDYKRFLCNSEHVDQTHRLISKDESICKNMNHKSFHLNYPSITIPNFKGKASIVRTVTNVGSPTSVYKARVSFPRGVAVKVVPSTLRFSSFGQNITFAMYFSGSIPKHTRYMFGSFSWVNGKQRVRSPLVVGSTYF